MGPPLPLSHSLKGGGASSGLFEVTLRGLIETELATALVARLAQFERRAPFGEKNLVLQHRVRFH